MGRYICISIRFLLVLLWFLSVPVFSDGWDKCVRDKTLQYIDDHAEDWREADALAMAYCDVKTPKSADRLSREKAEQELRHKMLQLRMEEEKEKKAQVSERERNELEKKRQALEKESILKFEVGEPRFLEARKYSVKPGVGINQSITIYRTNKEIARGEYHCKGTALIKTQDGWGGVSQERYAQIRASGYVVFGMDKMESTTSIDWHILSVRVISIADFAYECTARAVHESFFNFPPQ